MWNSLTARLWLQMRARDLMGGIFVTAWKRPSQLAMTRVMFLAGGLFFTALGFVGAFLPVLPTVPFLILAAACFARSSPRLENWLLTHPDFGPLLAAWRERGAIPVRAKWMAFAGMAFGFVSFLVFARPEWPLILAVLALMGSGLAYVFTRPPT